MALPDCGGLPGRMIGRLGAEKFVKDKVTVGAAMQWGRQGRRHRADGEVGIDGVRAAAERRGDTTEIPPN